MSESLWQDRDWKGLSLNDETETETENAWVSMTKPRVLWSDQDQDKKDVSLDAETKTEKNLSLHDKTGQ